MAARCGSIGPSRQYGPDGGIGPGREAFAGPGATKFIEPHIGHPAEGQARHTHLCKHPKPGGKTVESEQGKTDGVHGILLSVQLGCSVGFSSFFASPSKQEH
jgi:hypothetical protein